MERFSFMSRLAHARSFEVSRTCCFRLSIFSTRTLYIMREGRSLDCSEESSCRSEGSHFGVVGFPQQIESNSCLRAHS